MNIIEGVDQNQIETYDRMTKVLNGFIERTGHYAKTYKFPEGSYELRFYLKLDAGQYLTENYGSMSVGIYFHPNMDNPTLPLDIIRKPLDLFLNELINRGFLSKISNTHVKWKKMYMVFLGVFNRKIGK